MNTNAAKGRLLIVDDTPMNLHFLEMGFTLHGYEVQTARSGEQALTMAAEAVPDLIILDVLIPEMDGYEICRQIKTDSRLRDIPIIFVSALGETVDKVKGFEAGGVDYLTRPFELQEALARVQIHLTLYRQRKQIEQLLANREQAEIAHRQQHAIVNALLNSAIALSSTLKLDEVLERILKDVGQVVPHAAAMIILIEEDEAWVASFQTSLPIHWPVPPMRWLASEVEAIAVMLQSHQPYIIADTRTVPLWGDVPELEPLRSAIGVPIIAGDEMIGILGLLSLTPGYFTEKFSQRLQAFAVLAALAIKNARLYERAQELAVIQERQRLARELHDSISQTIFSANAIAELLPRIINSNPEKTRQYMVELAQLTREAMAEMRSLLFELRPETLAKTDLGVLIRQLCDTFSLKTRINVTLDVPENVFLPGNRHAVFYRVAQEALSNVEKHARATEVAVNLSRQAAGVELCIQDNGNGFDLQRGLTYDQGIRIMREGAATIGAEFVITSQPGQGTQVYLRG